MKKILIVVDMQNDFIGGTLKTPGALDIIPTIKAKISQHKLDGNEIIFTRDTHNLGYLHTQEGENLPVEHCIKGTWGHEIIQELDTKDCRIFDKGSFGSIALSDYVAKLSVGVDTIELCGVCTDICVVSNALILKAKLPETKIIVDRNACAGVTQESHNAAIMTMQMCQVKVYPELEF